MRDYKNNKKHFFIKSCVTNAFEDVYKGKTTTLVIIFYLVIHPHWLRIDINNKNYLLIKTSIIKLFLNRIIIKIVLAPEIHRESHSYSTQLLIILLL